jgi:SNF2 family DNA or RNA helicase
VIDELSKFKSAKSRRFRALKMIRPKVKRVVGLTGTPAPNGLLDLWPQMYLLDQGLRLGKTITRYRDNYFDAGARNGHVIYEYKLKQSKDKILGADIFEREIFDKIGDICISMKKEDYLDLPPRIDRDILITLPRDVMNQYFEFEKKMVLAIGDEDEISAVNAVALTTKLLQFANGAMYDDERIYHELHNAKIEKLEEVLETLNGNPLLLFYAYKHDLHRIQRHLGRYNPVVLKGSAEIEAWNEGKIPFMCVHPAGGSHGLNLQYGGHNIVHFSMHYNRDWYDQGTARLDRQGQQFSVINNRFIAKGTIDEEAAAAQDDKGRIQDAVMNAVKARFEKYKHQNVAI